MPDEARELPPMKTPESSFSSPEEARQELIRRGTPLIEGGSGDAKELTIKEKIDDLLKTPEGGVAEIVDPRLKAIAALAKTTRTGQRLGELLQQGDKLLGEEGGNPAFIGQWAKLAGVLDEERDKLFKSAVTPSSAVSMSQEVIDKLSEIADGVRASTATFKELGRVQETSRKIMTGEETEVIPESKEEQRKKFIQLVEAIEANDLSLNDYRNTNIAGRIGRAVEDQKMDAELREECMARLKLHHCAAIAAGIPGSIKEATGYLYGVFASPESLKYALEGEDFECLFKHKLDGLEIAKAFDLLQRANMIGININGKALRLSDDKLSSQERGMVRDELEKRLGGGKEARTSLKLAQRIAKATLETSVWNREMMGNDPLAEAIYFKNYRTGRFRAGRDRGPEVTIPYIEGFGTSFFRSAQTTKQIEIGGERRNVSLFLPDTEDSLYVLAGIVNREERIRRVLRRNRGQDFGFNEDNPSDRTVILVNPNKMDFSQIRPGEYAGWLGINVTRILAFKELLLQSTWKPEDFELDKVEGFIAPANAADPQEALHLREWLILGALWATYSRPSGVSVAWDNFSLHGVEDNLLKTVKTVEGGAGTFLTEGQLNWILKTLKESFRMNIHEEARRAGIRRSVSERFLGRRG